MSVTMTSPSVRENRSRQFVLSRSGRLLKSTPTTNGIVVRQLAPTVTRDQLLAHFVSSLAQAVVGEDVRLTFSLARAATELVDALLIDDGPTPQVSPGPEGGIAVEWLVNGSSLTLHIVSESDIRLWADSAAGEEIFDFELNANWKSNDESIRTARAFLKHLRGSIGNRVVLSSLAR
ncbi:hypothetical protein [Nocardioides sp.]|uniref:hypothetical protein n=1 Tax=Nocardioides sp. TaxID=35761 RepID=UPI002612E9EC|nr:hypothetical protein [Nocardioides sp.]